MLDHAEEAIPRDGRASLHQRFCDKHPDPTYCVNAHLARLSAERWPWACISSFHMTYHAHTWTLKLATWLTLFATFSVAQPTFQAHKWGHLRVSLTHFLFIHFVNPQVLPPMLLKHFSHSSFSIHACVQHFRIGQCTLKCWEVGG